MNFFPASIPEVIRVEPRVFGDARGFFMETYRDDKMVATGISGNFVQDIVVKDAGSWGVFNH